jgi:hypothetical protein
VAVAGVLNPHCGAKGFGLGLAQSMQIAAHCHGRTGTAWRRHTVLRPARKDGRARPTVVEIDADEVKF